MGCCLACQEDSPAGEADVMCGALWSDGGLAQTAAMGLHEVLDVGHRGQQGRFV